MVEIKRTKKDLDKKEQYIMTLNKAMKSVKDIPDQTEIHVVNFCYFDKVDEKTGEVVSLLSLLDKSGTVYCTQSETFKNDFSDIAEIFTDDPEFTIMKVSGVTKAGRGFVDCILV